MSELPRKSDPPVNGAIFPKNIFPHHLRDLRRSGLSDETIAAAGIHSEDRPDRLQTLLGWNVPKKIAPAMVIPFQGPDGSNGYVRIKPDTPRTSRGKPVKYESPRDRPNEIYIPPRTLDVIDDPAIGLIITEGEKKSLKADQEGFRCIGLVGVFGWKVAKAERLLYLGSPARQLPRDISCPRRKLQKAPEYPHLPEWPLLCFLWRFSSTCPKPLNAQKR